MRCRACHATVDDQDGSPICPACAAVTASPMEPERMAPASALWLWTAESARVALASGDLSLIIRAWRRATGTSQQQLAVHLGYDCSYISMIETGRREVVDIAARRRIAWYLGIPPHILGITDSDSADHATMLQFGYSTLRLATLARQSGHGAPAVNEIWPLVARLEARAADRMVDRDMLLLLARARAELGVSLGYVLPEERLAFAARWTGRALRLAKHLDDRELHAYTLRTNGNELRKAGHHTAALARLAHAVALAGPQQRAPALTQLARAARDPMTFDVTMDELLRVRDKHVDGDPLVGETALNEVQLRGLATTGRISEATRILSQTPAPAGPTSPQWRIIWQITVADLLLVVGDTATAESTFRQAVQAAEAYRLPHQIQRAYRVALKRHRELAGVAASALQRILPNLSAKA
jgi:transcriptional regulator with XRE-family HTH domain